MKKLISLLALLVVGSASLLFADEKSAVWERIYRNAFNDEMRYAVLLNIRELHDRQFGPLLTEALNDLLTRQISLGTTNEVDAKVRLATSLIQELGDLKEAGSSDLVFQVYKELTGFPFLRAEAAMALGKMRAAEYLPNLARDLSDLNLPPDRDRASAQEIVAFGLVQSLAAMRDSRGYEPVFFASIGWYGPQRKVKETARQALKTLADDPTDSLLKILTTQPGPVNKLEVLKAENDSKAPDAGKSRVALAVLESGVTTVAPNIVEATQWSDLRKEALRVLARANDKTATAVTLYRQQYKTAGLARDTSEILSVIQILGTNGSPEAMAYLIELMTGFNVRASTPGLLTDFDVQQIRAVLQSFKTAADAAARPVLMQAQYIDYTPALKRDVKAVLDGLPK